MTETTASDPRFAVASRKTPADADESPTSSRSRRETGLELAVWSGGHSGAGHGTSDGGIVLDLSSLKSMELGAEERTAWAETGLTAGEVTASAAAHRLGISFGDTGSVGIRRAHARPRRRLHGAQARAYDRPPPRRRDRHGGRRAARDRRVPPCGPLLGDPRAAAATSASPPGSDTSATRWTRRRAESSSCPRRRRRSPGSSRRPRPRPTSCRPARARAGRLDPNAPLPTVLLARFTAPRHACLPNGSSPTGGVGCL